MCYLQYVTNEKCLPFLKYFKSQRDMFKLTGNPYTQSWHVCHSVYGIPVMTTPVINIPLRSKWWKNNFATIFFESKLSNHNTWTWTEGKINIYGT